MSKTSSRLPVCVHCGTARPADETTCPTCGKPWIDTTIGSTTPMVVSTEVDQDTDEGDDTEEIPIVPPVVPQAADPSDAVTEEQNTSSPDVVPAPPPPPPLDSEDDFSFDDWTEEPTETHRTALVWLIPLVMAVAAAVVWVVVFIDNPSAPTTTTVDAAPTTTILEPTTTTVAASGNTEPTTTTPPSAPTAFPPPSAWAPIGEALAVDEFAMKAAGIGPLDFGMTIEEVAGLLGAGFGEAIASGIDRVCPPNEAYWLQWGDLMVIFDSSDPGASFVSYRNESSDISGPALGFTTLSGLELGDTVAELRSTYTSYTISFDRVDSTTYFNLYEGGDLLLWGPVSNPDSDGVIEGIYSPSPCPSV